MKKLSSSTTMGFWLGLTVLVTPLALATNDQPPPVEQQVFYSLEDISHHSSASNCWVAIASQVYDLSNYIAQHPPGPAVLIEWCGRDASVGMRTKGYGRDHSPAAWEMLEAYAIGVLKE